MGVFRDYISFNLYVMFINDTTLGIFVGSDDEARFTILCGEGSNFNTYMELSP
jgi:hypothetical protein